MSEEEEDYQIIEETSDPIAARADSFGKLAVRMEVVKDEKVRELCFQMLRQLIRSIKTPPDAELREITGGKQ